LETKILDVFNRVLLQVPFQKRFGLNTSALDYHHTD
jgi:hypothetical protein